MFLGIPGLIEVNPKRPEHLTQSPPFALIALKYFELHTALHYDNLA